MRARPVGPARRPRPSRGCASGSGRRIASPRSDPPASAWSATRRSRTTAATPAAAGSARCSAPSASRPSPCARRRGAPSPTPTRCWPRRKDLRARSFGPATAKYRDLGTLANLLDVQRALARCPGRNFGDRDDDARARGPGRRCATAARRARSAASGSCRRRDGRSARVEYESAFALGPLVGIDDPDAVLDASARCDELGLDTISTGGTIAWAMEAGVARRGCAFGDAGGAAARDRARSARARASATCWPRARARASARFGRGGARDARQGARAARLRAAHAARDGARPRRQRARRRPQPLRAPTRPTSPASSTGSTAATAHVAAAIETEDRAAAMDSLILCKFLRGVFDDPWEEWAALLAPVTGWDIDARRARTTPRAASSPPSTRSTAARAGRARRTRCRERLLDVPLTLPSGREAVLTRERLDAMVDAYHRGARTGHICPRSRSCGGAMALSVPPKTDAPTVTLHDRRRRGDRPRAARRSTRPPSRPGSRSRSSATTSATTRSASAACASSTSAARVLAAACVRPCEDGMEVTTGGAKVEQQRDGPDRAADGRPAGRGPEGDDHRRQPAARRWRGASRPATPSGCRRRAAAGVDDSNPVISVNHHACILCDRCIRACDDIQGNDVIGRTGKGYDDADRVRPRRPDGRVDVRRRAASAWPPARRARSSTSRSRRPDPPARRAQGGRHASARTAASAARSPTTSTRSAARSSSPTAASSPATRAGLCVKGRYGFDYATSPAAPDEAADPRRSYPKGPLSGDVKGEGRGRKRPGRHRRLRRGAAALPRGDLGGGARPRRVAAQGDPRPRRLRRDRRLRLGQVLQRGGLPLPEADPRGLRHEQRRPLHAPLPRLAASRRCSRASAPAPSRRPTATSSTPTSRSSPARTRRRTTRSRPRSSSRRAGAARS